MDLSKLSDSDLLALQAGNLSKVSNEGLMHLSQLSDDNEIPSKGYSSKPTSKSEVNKAIEFLSGGKAGNLQQWMYGGEKPADTILGKTSQLVRESGLEGLQGMPVSGQLESAVTAIGSNIPTASSVAAKIAEKAPITAKVAQSVGSKLANALKTTKELPARYLAYESKVPMQELKGAYQIGKEQNPAVVEKFKDVLEATDLQPIGQYKYARRFGLPPEEAGKVTRMGYEDEQAFWNVLDKYLKEGNKPFPVLSPNVEFSKLSDADKLRYAQDIGMSLSSLKPTSKAGQVLGSAEGGLAALEATNLFPAITKGIIGAKFAPLLAAHAASKSPYLAGRAAYGAGRAANIIAPLMAAEVPTNQTAALLARMLSNQGEE